MLCLKLVQCKEGPCMAGEKEVILGIDPGFRVTGFAVLQADGSTARLLDYGYLKLPTKKHLSHRIGIFYNTMNEKVLKHGVTSIALETPFLGKNVQTFLKLGYLRGSLYLLADQHSAVLHEFSPREVKLAVTGYGGASKDQVATMVLRLFPKISQLKAVAKNDVTDALAVCLSGFWAGRQRGMQLR